MKDKIRRKVIELSYNEGFMAKLRYVSIPMIPLSTIFAINSKIFFYYIFLVTYFIINVTIDCFEAIRRSKRECVEKNEILKLIFAQEFFVLVLFFRLIILSFMVVICTLCYLEKPIICVFVCTVAYLAIVLSQRYIEEKVEKIAAFFQKRLI